MELARLPKIKVSNTLQYNTTEDDLEAPIMGYEIRQPCNRHTVYKIYVHYSESGQGWFVYRRYSEFYKLKADLAKIFPAKEFTMPAKRYFGDNFEPRFLSSRRQGLQGFLYMMTRQKDVQKSLPVADFLSLNNPPSDKDDLEQCQAVIKQLKEVVTKLETDKSDHDATLLSSHGQIIELHDQKQAVLAALRYERQQNGRKFYPGDDLSLMFEYRSLPEVCRVDVSSFLVRKPPAYLARKFEEKTRKEDTRLARDHERSSATRPRSRTPPISEHGGRYGYDLHKEREKRDSTRAGKAHAELAQSPRAHDCTKKQFPSSENVTSSSGKAGEFQSFYDFRRRRKSMPGAVEFHTVSNMLMKASAVQSQSKSDTPRPTSLAVPFQVARPRSYSAQMVGESTLGSNWQHTNTNRVKKQSSLDGPVRKSFGWSSLRDLNKFKGKV